MSFLKLPDRYGRLMTDFSGKNIFGVRIDDSPMLRDLVRLAFELAEKPGTTEQKLQRIEALVLANLSSTWTFSDRRLECSVDYPLDATVGRAEVERWFVGLRTPSAFELVGALISHSYLTFERMHRLSAQLHFRIGDCAMYTIVLGFLLYTSGLAERVFLMGKAPHAWNYVLLRGKGCPVYIDLARRSHGVLETDVAAELQSDTTDVLDGRDDPDTKTICIVLE